MIWTAVFLVIVSSIYAFEVKVNNPFPGQMISGIFDVNITCDSDFDNISIYLNNSLQDSFVPPGCNYNHNSVSYPFNTNLVGNGIYTLRVMAFKNEQTVADSVQEIKIRNNAATKALDWAAGFINERILSKNYFFIGVLLVTILFVIFLFSVRVMAAPHPGTIGKSSIEELASEGREKSFQEQRPFEIMPLEEMPRHKAAKTVEEPEAKAEETDNVEQSIQSIKDEQKEDYISSKKQKELEFFVKHCRRQGYSSEDIRIMLVKQGWDEAFVDEFLKSN